MGLDNDGDSTILKSAHSDGNGGKLEIKAGSATSGQTDKLGGDLELHAGSGTGGMSSGVINFFGHKRSSSGTTLHSTNNLARFACGTSSTDLYIFENAGASAADYFRIKVSEHGATVMSTVDGGGTDGNLEISADGNIVIEPSGTGQLENNWNVNGEFSAQSWNQEDPIFFSSTSGKPVIEIKNTTDDSSSPTIKLNNSRSSDGSNNDFAGIISFNAKDDGTPSAQEYGQINVRAHDVTSTEESGAMNLYVAAHNGNLSLGLQLQGGSESGEIDVNVGAGTSSSTTVAGDLTVTSKATMPSRVYAYPGTSDGDHAAGDVMYYDLGGATTIAGQVYYFNGSGSWTVANADAVADSTGMLAVALGTDPDVDGMLLRGFVTAADISGTEDHGAKIYLATTDGRITTTAPGSGNVVRVLGYNLHNTNNSIYFNPDNSWVEVS